MNARLPILIAAIALWFASHDAIASPSFNITSFSAASGIQLVGNAAYSSSKLRLTSSKQSQSSAAWITTPQDVTQSFATTVNFTIAGPIPTGTSWTNGSDGFALVIQNDPRALSSVIGGGGDEIGYGADATEPLTAIRRSLAVALRTTVFQKIQVYTNGDSPFLRFPDAGGSPLVQPIAQQNGKLGTILGIPQTLTLQYDAGNQAVTVLLNNASIGIDEAPLGASLSSIVGGNSATFGFTAGTGGGYATTDITAFSATAAVPEPNGGLLVLILVLSPALGRCSRRLIA